MATQNIVIHDSYWYNVEERRKKQLTKNKRQSLTPNIPEEPNINDQHRLNALILWNQIKQNPNANVVIFDLYDFCAMIIHALNFDKDEDRYAFFSLLQNKFAREAIIAVLTNANYQNPQQAVNLDAEICKYGDEILFPEAKNVLLSKFGTHEQFAREFFLHAPQAAQLFSADFLRYLMLVNKGAAMAIAQQPLFAEKLKATKFTPEQIIYLFAKQADADAPWQTKGHAYHAALLYFFLNYRREDLIASGLLDKAAQSIDRTNKNAGEIAAIKNLHRLLYGGKYHNDLAVTIAANPEVLEQLYIKPKNPACITSFAASTRDPLVFLQQHHDQISNAQIMHAVSAAMPPRTSQRDLEKYLKTAGDGRTSNAMRLQGAALSHINKPSANTAGNHALLAIVNNPHLRKAINFTSNDAIKWMANTNDIRVDRFFSKEDGFLNGIAETERHKLIAKSPYFQAANVVNEGVAAADGGWLNRKSVRTQNYLQNFVNGENLDQAVCAHIAANKDHWDQVIKNIEYDFYFFELISIRRDPLIKIQFAEKSPFFAAKIYRKSLAELALWDEYRSHFIEALGRQGKDVLILETLLSASDQQLEQLKAIPAVNQAIKIFIHSEHFELLSSDQQKRIETSDQQKRIESALANDDINSTASPVDEKINNNPFENVINVIVAGDIKVGANGRVLPPLEGFKNSDPDSQVYSASDASSTVSPSPLHSKQTEMTPIKGNEAKQAPFDSPVVSHSGIKRRLSYSDCNEHQSPGQNSTASPLGSTQSPGQNSTASPQGSTASPQPSTTSPKGSTASPADSTTSPVPSAAQYKPVLQPPAMSNGVAENISCPGLPQDQRSESPTARCVV